MDIHDLQSVLRERADGAAAGGPDIDALVGKGRALRRRRQLATGAGAALVVAAAVAVPVLLSGGSDSGSGPATIVPTVSPTPSPAPSTAPPTAAPSTTAPAPSASVAVVIPAPLLPSSAPTSAAPPVDSSVLAYGDCQTPTFEPSEIVTACADRGLIFQDLHWTSWTSTSATAVGTEWYKTCVPSCAAGGSQTVPGATITLSAPVRDAAGRLIWSEIQFSPQPPGYATGPYHGGPFPLPVRPD